MTKYDIVEPNDSHLITIIKWLFDEVRSAGGDGDGIWYSQYYNVNDLAKFIRKNNLLPEHWIMVINPPNKHSYHLGYSQESLLITNDEEDFNTRPSWQQVALVY